MILGLMIGLAGVCTIFYDYIGLFANRSFIIGISMAMMSTVSWAFGTVYSSRQKLSIGILYSVGLQMLIAGTLMLVICFISGKYVNLATTGYSSWYALLYLIFIGSLITYSAYVFAISKLPPTLVSVYAYINPVVAVLLGWILLQEKMNIHMIAGTLIILYGVYLVNREYRRLVG
jgi:drug/metabolite transporter (DMT)-like permease